MVKKSFPFTKYNASLEEILDGPGEGGAAHRNTERQVVDGLRTEVCGQQKQSNDPHNSQHSPQYANYWAPLTCKQHSMPQPAQPQHTNYWAPRTRKRHQREHRPHTPAIPFPWCSAVLRDGGIDVCKVPTSYEILFPFLACIPETTA